MPGWSGIELQHAMKMRDAALPLILITGHGDIPMAVNAIKEGAFDFIEKPFDYERLIESIAKAICVAIHAERMPRGGVKQEPRLARRPGRAAETAKPKPFKWTAKANIILEKNARARRALEEDRCRR